METVDMNQQQNQYSQNNNNQKFGNSQPNSIKQTPQNQYNDNNPNYLNNYPPPEDYNYRTAKRCNTMYLSTLNNQDVKMKKFKQVNTNRDYSANLFNLDIPGTSPKKFGVLNNKPDFTNRNDDIDRSNSKVLHIHLNKPEYNLSNKDIEFSSASTVRIHETRCSKHTRPGEPLNPLEPKYKLPQVELLEPPVPKFIRDNIQINDIQGSFPKKYYKWETRKGNLDDNKIEGSCPKKPHYRTNSKYDYINYNDVTQDKFKSKRCVNPLDPVYEVKYKNK
jgi:hypothetical protein